jgi:NAD(P)-dependent dehydrogenase (short-subunit alcohol dehydrogenase family)
MDDNVAIIGIGGFGMPCARRLGFGRHLLIGDVNEAMLDQCRTALEEEGYRVTAQRVDVSDRGSVDAFAAAARGLGRLHSVIVTAGISPRTAPPLKILEINLLGTVYAVEAFEPLLAKGSVGVMFASNAAYYAPVPPEVERELALAPSERLIEACQKVQGWDTGLGAYWLAKRCIQLRVQSAAPAWGKRGARIVSVSPGIFSTAMIHNERKMGSPVDQVVGDSPVNRIGNPDEIGAAVEYLTGPAARYITGSDLLIDGGAIAAMRWTGMEAEDPTDASRQVTSPAQVD